ncbi:MAG: dihydrodipicolinate reductase [Parachlamydiaceae bacterium]|nr:dihydrodipicolinate reductase [Parachlamydiaceae bacterium]
MKIALIGYGKMGQMVEKAALERGHSIAARISASSWNADADAAQKADIWIEFSNPHSAVENIIKAAQMKKPIVVGTTGWYDQLGIVQSTVEQQQIGAVYSPNYSIGINLYVEIASQVSSLLEGFPEYDVAGIEYHHNKKQDAPSGTALAIAAAVEKNMKRIDKVSFSSVRCGSIPGTHTLLFDSPCDTISITHEARSREGFAAGAVLAAEWVQGKTGLYTFGECIQEYIYRRST